MNLLVLIYGNGTIVALPCRIGDDMGEEGSLVAYDDNVPIQIDGDWWLEPWSKWSSFIRNMRDLLGPVVSAEVITK